MNILVTGGKGQLGMSLLEESRNFYNIRITHLDINDLDITHKNAVASVFAQGNFDVCINCAAYTAVDKAEEEESKASDINVSGVQNLALICRDKKVVLIHVSTDFVFNGNASIAYTEGSKTDPLGIYGKTKVEGENAILKTCKEYFIIRTSWLYSEFGNNFMKTVLNLAQDRDLLTIVDDQIGTPTYARDLARAIFQIINSESKAFGIYHYSNEGVASWYDFAAAIIELKMLSKEVKPIKSNAFKTLAERPKFSVLDKSKIKETFNLKIPHWRQSLKNAINQMDEQ